MEDTLLEVRDLQVEFSTKMGIVRVLDKVNLKVDPRQTVGIIGESGCGKSMMALSIMGLVPIPPGRIAGGEILYRGTDLLTLEKDAILDIRGKRIAMIFQEPMNSLNPVFTVGNQLVETLLRHEDMTRQGRVGQERRHAQGGGYPFPREADARLFVSDVGRYAPARDDRHEPVPRSRHPHRGTSPPPPST